MTKNCSNGVRFVFLLVALAIFGWGCASPRARRVDRGAFSRVPPGAAERPGPPMTLAGLRPSTVGPNYLGPGDLLSINVFNPSDPSAGQKYELRVSLTGEIKLPQLDSVNVIGHTVVQLEEELTRRFEQFFTLSPIVTVVPVYATRAVMVMGAVTHPGAYELPRYRSTVLDALISAGGPSDLAGDSVMVIRASDEQLTPGEELHQSRNPGEIPTRRIPLDLDGLLSGDMSLNIELQDGDFVWVPPGPSPFLYIQGYVREPRRYQLARNEQLSLTQALAMAGGLTSLGAAGNIKVVRHFGSGADETVKADLDKIAEGKQPNVIVGAGDSLVVGSSFSRQVLWFVRGILTMGVAWRLDM